MTADGDDEDVSRRWLIRALVGLGIGIPIAVEATTFLGLLSSRLGGGDSGTEAPATTTASGTGIGEELLPATAPADTLADAFVQVADDAWRFEATVTVANTTDGPYTLKLGAVTTGSGSRVDGGHSSGRVPPGESRTFTGAWPLPAGETPATLDVTGVRHADGGEETTRTVRLGDVPVRG